MDENTRVVSDLALAAFLAAAGHRLLGIRRTNNRGAFMFEDNPRLGEDILRYYNRKASVDPLTFAETLRSLKAAAQAV